MYISKRSPFGIAFISPADARCAVCADDTDDRCEYQYEMFQPASTVCLCRSTRQPRENFKGPSPIQHHYAPS